MRCEHYWANISFGLFIKKNSKEELTSKELNMPRVHHNNEATKARRNEKIKDRKVELLRNLRRQKVQEARGRKSKSFKEKSI